MGDSAKKILVVEEDPVLRAFHQERLQHEDFQVLTAEDGLGALSLISQDKPEAVVLDLMLPRFDGLEVLKQIRADADLKAVPVVVLVNPQLAEWTREAVKAGANKSLVRAECTPSRLLSAVQDVLGCSPLPVVKTNGTPADSGRHRARECLVAARAAHAEEATLKAAREAYDRDAPFEMARIHDHCLACLQAMDPPANLEPLNGLYQCIHFLSARAGLAGYTRIALLAGTFEALLFHLLSKPAEFTASVRQTIAQTVDALGGLFLNEEAGKGGNKLKARILIVDDDAVGNGLMVAALKRAHFDPISVEGPRIALQLLKAHHFDVVLLGINRPRLDGFGLCEVLRQMPHHQTTPVIFITDGEEFQDQSHGVFSGGNDLIPRPVGLLELVLKTTVHLLRPLAAAGSGAPILSELWQALAAASSAPPQAVGAEANASVAAGEKAAVAHGSPNGPADSPAAVSGPTGSPAAAAPSEGPPAASAVEAAAAPQTAPDESLPSHNRNGPDDGTLVSANEPAGGTADSATESNPSESPADPAIQLQPQSLDNPHPEPIMQNPYAQAFDEITQGVARVIFGDDNVSEMNLRLTRIALEHHNIHEILNRLADANGASGKAPRLTPTAG